MTSAAPAPAASAAPSEPLPAGSSGAWGGTAKFSSALEKAGETTEIDFFCAKPVLDLAGERFTFVPSPAYKGKLIDVVAMNLLNDPSVTALGLSMFIDAALLEMAERTKAGLDNYHSDYPPEVTSVNARLYRLVQCVQSFAARKGLS